MSVPSGGVAKTIPGSRCEPVATVRMQKTEIKYKKPTVLDCADDLPFRSVGRNRLTRHSVRRSPVTWRSWVRTRTLALGVGGRLFLGKSARTYRPLFHSQIFFPQLNVFGALPRWKSSPAYECKHRRKREGRQRIANERQSLGAREHRLFGSRDGAESHLGMIDLFSGASLPRGAVKLPKAGDRTGRFMTHFFTQNSGNIFFKDGCAGMRIEKNGSKK